MAQIIFKLKRTHVGVGSGEYDKYYHNLVISDIVSIHRLENDKENFCTVLKLATQINVVQV